ncbi:hypothetical protein AB0M54_46535 [Actinoplanes sp. NPDC051470]|uniref:hypothetical protein n=1 Tax=Actinoplanes sp. NPDC051470 TaxID=3157224 RepID=UPI0034336F08
MHRPGHRRAAEIGLILLRSSGDRNHGNHDHHDESRPVRLLAFTVDTRAEVSTFYQAALSAGATSLLTPAVHPEYHADYFGGFVVDPHGVNLEAVCHAPDA